MTSRKHTHVGTCQACARKHAVGITSGNLAKHGYTTRFGYFAGTCSGSDKAPLEISREFADRIVIELRNFSNEQDAKAAALRGGRAFVARVKTDEYERDENGKYRRDREARRIPVFVAWGDATAEQRARAAEAAACEHNNNSRGARNHAAALEALIPKVHGQPLTSVVPSAAELAADAPLAVGDTVRLFGKDGHDAVVIAIRDKVAQGCGPALNGRVVPHAVYTRNGRDYAYPVCRIRKAAIIKRAGA
jgi:hypothetical protein